MFAMRILDPALAFVPGPTRFPVDFTGRRVRMDAYKRDGMSEAKWIGSSSPILTKRMFVLHHYSQPPSTIRVYTYSTRSRPVSG